MVREVIRGDVLEIHRTVLAQTHKPLIPVEDKTGDDFAGRVGDKSLVEFTRSPAREQMRRPVAMMHKNETVHGCGNFGHLGISLSGLPASDVVTMHRRRVSVNVCALSFWANDWPQRARSLRVVTQAIAPRDDFALCAWVHKVWRVPPSCPVLQIPDHDGKSRE